MLLERRSDANNGNLNFLSLALVFGAVGMISFITASPTDDASGVSQIYSGNLMKGTKQMPKENTGSITDQVNEEYFPVEQSPW